MDPTIRHAPTPPSPRRPASRESVWHHRDDPWPALSPDLAARLRPRAGEAAAAILQEIQKRIPEYSRPLDGRFGWAMTEGIENSVNQFIDRMSKPDIPRQETPEVFRRIGKLQLGERDGLGSLQTAYHIGARVSWRLLTEFGKAANLPASTMCQLADALFSYVDELSALSNEGYAAARTRAAGTLERHRRRLLAMLISQPPAARETLTAQAEHANWPLPEEIAAVALEPAGEPTALAIDDGVLADLAGDAPFLLVADPDERRAELAAVLTAETGRRAAVGPKAGLTEAAKSLRWARRTLELVNDGIIEDAQLTWSEEHLSELILATDELINDLVRRTLAPLRALSAKQRARLSATLLARLETRGSAPEIASRLHIHPQTVRYRLRQLDALFGHRLRNPDDRFDLEIALRAHRLLNPGDAG